MVVKSKTKKNNPKVSIVVPIYNVEKYLKKCVDSILEQTLKDIEVILVDDGSPDKCGQIVDEYAKKDKRVVAVHQNNSGYSAAVNHGIEIARGEYIGIIESDDWIDMQMYEKLYDRAIETNADVTKCEFYYYNSTVIGRNRNVRFVNNSGRVDLRNAPDNAFHVTEWPEIIAFHSSIWSCLYKSDFVKKIKLIDTKGASYQDFPFMVEVMTRAESIAIVKEPLLHWRNDPAQGNSTSARSKKLLFMAINTLNAYDILKDSGYYDELKEAFYAQAAWANYWFFIVIDKKYRRQYFEYLQKIFKPLKDDYKFNYSFFDYEQTHFDSWMVNCALNMNWSQFRREDRRRRWRFRAQRILCKVSPTYRASVYVKGMINEDRCERDVYKNVIRRQNH